MSVTVRVSGVPNTNVLPYAVADVLGRPTGSTTAFPLVTPARYEMAKVSGVQIAVSVLFAVPVIGEPAAYVFEPSLQPPKVKPGLVRVP